MATITLENLYLDEVPKTFKGYVNKDFYLHGYAPYFDLATIKDILTSLKEINDSRCYETKWRYIKKSDTFIYEDKENGCGKEMYKGEDVETEDGIKHLYSTGEWMWEIDEDEDEEYSFDFKIIGYYTVNVTAKTYEEAERIARNEICDVDFGYLENIDSEIID